MVQRSARPLMENASRGTSVGGRKGGHTHAGLDLSVNIVSGQDLAACDYNMLGKPTTSDPYVIVSILRESGEPILLGRTKHINANLNPQWNATIAESLPAGTFQSDHYTLRFTVMDKDMIGSDDCMGIVEIHLGLETISKPNAWYDIVEGSAPNASGRIQVGIEAKLTYTMDSFRPGKGSSSHGKDLEGDARKMALASNLPGMVLGAGTEAAKTVFDAGLGVGAIATNTVADGVTATATGAAKGVTGIGGRFFKKGSKKSREKADEEEYENIYKEEEHLMLEITAHKGEGLVAKDRNVMGKKVTSDPYVAVEIWPKGIPSDMEHEKNYPKERFGRSPTVMKTLNPEWDYAFDVHYVPLDHLDIEEAQLRVRIIDDDFGISVDDPMGSIDIHLQAQKELDVKEKWYPVSAISATRASGRVQLSICTTKVKQQVVIGTKKKKVIQADPVLPGHSNSTGSNDEEESVDEEALAKIQAERRAKKEEARRASRRQRQERSRRNIAGSRREGMSQSERLDENKKGSRRRGMSTSARRVNSRDKDGSRRERRTHEPGVTEESSRRRVVSSSARRVNSRDENGSRRERRTLETGVDGEISRRRANSTSARQANGRNKDGSRRERRTIEPGANGDDSQRMARSARTSSRRENDDKVPSSPKKHAVRSRTSEKKTSTSSRRMDGSSRRAEGSSRRVDGSSKLTGNSSKRTGDSKRHSEKVPVVDGLDASAMNTSSTSLGRSKEESRRRRGMDASSSRRRNGEASSSRRRPSEDDERVKSSRSTGEKKKSSRSGIASKDKHEAGKTGSSHRRSKQVSCDTSPRRIPQ